MNFNNFTREKLVKAVETPMVKPPFLKKGDTIMIVAPAGFLPETAAISQGIDLVKSWGLHVILGTHTFKKHRHFAGTDDQRRSDLQHAINDRNVKAIWCLRGGYGTIRIIDQIDFSPLVKHPKWLVGFSDITVLHSMIHNHGLMTIHASMPAGIKTATMESQKSLYKALFGQEINIEIPTNQLNRLGEVKGVLVGGNLCILQSLIGSASEVNTEGKILFIEEVGEDLYRVDRMMHSLKRAKILSNLKALIVGDFCYDKEKNTLFGDTHREIIRNAVDEFDYPVLFDFPAGHISDNHALIFGKEIHVEVRESLSSICY